MAMSRTRNGTLMRRASGTLARGPCDCDCGGGGTTVCDACPECDPGMQWTGTISDEGELADLIGDGGPWGLFGGGFDTGEPITAICEPFYGVGGHCRVIFDYCGKTLRLTLTGSIYCQAGEYFGEFTATLEQQKTGGWCGIGLGGCSISEPGCTVRFPVTVVGGCDAECRNYISRGSFFIYYSEDPRELLEEGCGMDEGELLECYTPGAVFATADLNLSLVQDDCS